MTDTNPPEPNDLDELDDLASAILDGEATADEQARAATDRRVGQRVDVFRTLSAQVADVADLDDDTRAALLMAARSGFDPVLGADQPTSTPPPPTELDERRAKRRRRQSLPIVAVAAVVIAILAVPALLIGLNRDSGVHDMAASTAGSDSALDESTAGAEARSSSDAAVTTIPSNAGSSSKSPTSVPPGVELGEVDTPAELKASVQRELSSASVPFNDHPSTTTATATAPTTSVGAPVGPDAFRGSCESPIRTKVAGLETLLLSGTVDYRGIPREIYAFEIGVTGDQAGSRAVVIVVVASDTCDVVSQTTVAVP